MRNMIAIFTFVLTLQLHASLANPLETGASIRLPNTFNTIQFDIENVIGVKTLDSTIQVSCIIHKELIFVDAISQAEKLTNVYGHGMVELNKNMQPIKSRFYLFRIQNAPDKFILATTENDPTPNTIIADQNSVVDGQKHLDSIFREGDQILFEHYENSILYEKGQIVGFKIKSLIPIDEEFETNKSVVDGYEEDVYVEPLIDLEEISEFRYFEKHIEPVSFLDGKVIGYHQIVDLSEEANPYNTFYEQEYDVLDADGYLLYADQVYWDIPMQATQGIKLWEQDALAMCTNDAIGATFIFNEVADHKINKSYNKQNHHLMSIDKRGNELLSLAFESDHQFQNKYGTVASQEVEKTLVSDIELKQINGKHKLKANFFWFNSNRLLNEVSTSVDVSPTPSFKEPKFEVSHFGSIQVSDNIRCVVYKMEETSEADMVKGDLIDYHKTWYGFLTFDQKGNKLGFEYAQAFIRDEKPAQIEMMSNKKNEIVFTISRPNYIINSFKKEVIGKQLSMVKINRLNGTIKKSHVEFDLFQ